MSAADIKTALQSVVSTITGIAPESVVWRGTLAERSVVIATRAVLYTSSKVSVGVDETLYENPANPADDLIVTMVGNRKFTWSILIETQDLTDASQASDMMDLIRLNLRRESMLTVLRSAGLAVSSFAGTQSTEFLSGGRTVYQATMDVYMLTTDQSIDDSLGSGDWIGETLINGELGPTDPPIDVNLDVNTLA